ncbi:hypothetical protein BJ122_10150 [Rhodopseudomonas faecalis]|uniref:Uncharacterized protein n=1 Tax=Rhodopseudomonas faecalis TaxID=99655 RepID=A0A318TLI3_9BRAD|nr:hypothetical protein [Rhodopseudomonas faecalis]PYF05313.1 hypothetical protein BJ122_10150 [Rhodopseudomonas faecalis]
MIGDVIEIERVKYMLARSGLGEAAPEQQQLTDPMLAVTDAPSIVSELPEGETAQAASLQPFERRLFGLKPMVGIGRVHERCEAG